MHYAAWTPVSLHGSRFSGGTTIQRGRQTVPTKVFAAGDYLCAQPRRRTLSQPAKPAGESSVQIRLASLARNFRDRMRDPPDSRPRCLFSLQCVPTAQSSGALFGAMAPVDASASRRCPQAAGSSALVREFTQGRQPMLWAHRQYLRLGARPLEVGFGCDLRLLPSCPQTGTSVSGSISAMAPSPRAHPHSLPVRSSLFHPRKSPLVPNPIGPPSGRSCAHPARHNHVPGHSQLPDRSPLTYLPRSLRPPV